MMKWLRLIAGPSPVLRLIALLLALVAGLLYLLVEDIEYISRNIPETCGNGTYYPCSVRIVD